MSSTAHSSTARSVLRAVGTAATIGLLAVVSGCGGDDESSSPVSLVDGAEAKISAIDNSFRPEALTVQAGTEVVWTNDGRTPHNVLPVEDADWGVPTENFKPDDEYRYRFTEPGTYAFYCSLHGTKTHGMVGTLEVTG